MRKKRKLKIAVALMSIVLALMLLWVVLLGMERHLGERAGEANAEAEAEEQTEQTADADEAEGIGETENEIQGKVKIKGTTYTYDHEFENWLFIGTDASGNETGEGEEYRGTMADFLLLAVIDHTDNTYAFLQLNRDTITEIRLMQTNGEGHAYADIQLCTAHWYGGNPEQSCENTVEAVSKLLGKLEIDGYCSMNMEDIPVLNHAVGGVEVDVLSDFGDFDPTLKKGEHVLLNDEQAYHYVRARFGVGDETNIDRMARQKQYMEAFLTKVKGEIRTNPGFINTLYQDMEDITVSSLTGKDLSRLAKQMQDSESRGIFQIEGETKIGQKLGDGIDHVEFYPDKESLKNTLVELYHLEEKE